MNRNWSDTSKLILALANKQTEVLFRPEILSKFFVDDPSLTNISRIIGMEWLTSKYLEKLNKPMQESNLFPLFGEEMINLNPINGGMIYFDEISEICDIGLNIKMPILKYETDKKFAPLTMTRKSWLNESVIAVTICTPDTHLPKKHLYPSITLEKETLVWLNEELSQRNRFLLPESLTKSDEKSVKISREDIKIFDQNDKYYTVINMGGEPILLNRINSKNSQGEVTLIRLPEEEILLIRQLRPLIGKLETGTPRGWAKENLSFIDEASALSGMKVTGKEQVIKNTLWQTRYTDYARLNFNIVIFNKYSPKISENTEQVLSESGMESSSPVRFTDKQIWQEILYSHLWEATTITAIGLMWLRLNLIRITERGYKLGMIFEHRKWHSGLSGLDLPRVPVGTGEKLTELMPDSGCKRIFNNVEKIKTTDLPGGHTYEFLSTQTIFDNYLSGEFDALAGAAIMVGLMREGLIELTH